MTSPVDPATLDTWIASAMKGDRQAFRKLYEAHVGAVLVQVARLVGPGSPAEDVTQEVFIEVYKALPTFKGDARFSTWLYRVTRNVAISYLRKRGSEAVDLASYRALAEAVHQPDLDARRQVGALWAALKELPFEAREAFVLFEIEGMPLNEIAALTSEPLHTVASRIRRTRERLRSLLERMATPLRKAL